MASLVVLKALSVDYKEPRGRVAEFKTTAISWYTTRFSNRRDYSQDGYCGQDETALLYLHLPRGSRVNFNLNRTHPNDDFQLENYADDCDIAELLAWIESMSHCHENSFRDAEIVCQRFDLINFMLMPYNDYDFKMQVAKCEGKIYIRKVSSKRDIADTQNCLRSDFETKRSKQGLILQHFLLSDSPNAAPVPSKPYIRGERATYVVFQGEIGKHKLLYDSKVKALDKPEDLLDIASATFTDVRTNNGNSSANIKWNKWLNFWGNHITGKKSNVAVAFVSNVHTGIVENLEVIKGTTTMQNCQKAFARDKYVAKFHHTPTGAVCFETLDNVFTFLKRELKHAGPSEVFELEFNSKQMKVILNKLDSKLGERGVLPEWYKSWLSAK